MGGDVRERRPSSGEAAKPCRGQLAALVVRPGKTGYGRIHGVIDKLPAAVPQQRSETRKEAAADHDVADFRSVREVLRERWLRFCRKFVGHERSVANGETRAHGRGRVGRRSGSRLFAG